MTWTDIYFVRHGAAVSSRARRLVSRGDDGGLTEPGRRQAQRAADVLQGERLAAVYASPLRRAQETASVLAARHRLPVVTVPEAAELDFGELEGSTDRDAHRRVEEQINRWCDGDRTGGFPGGEDLPRLIGRTERLLSAIQLAHQGESVALVGHGGTLQAYLQHAADDIGRTLAWHYFPNCAVAHLRVRAGSSGLHVTVMEWLVDDPERDTAGDPAVPPPGLATLWPAGLRLLEDDAGRGPRRTGGRSAQLILLRGEPLRLIAERLLIAQRLAEAGLLAVHLVRPSSGRLGVPVRGGLWTVWRRVPHRRLGVGRRPAACGAVLARAHAVVARLRYEVPLLATVADGLGSPGPRVTAGKRVVVGSPWALGSVDSAADLAAWQPRGHSRAARAARAAFTTAYASNGGGRDAGGRRSAPNGLPAAPSR